MLKWKNLTHYALMAIIQLFSSRVTETPFTCDEKSTSYYTQLADGKNKAQSSPIPHCNLILSKVVIKLLYFPLFHVTEKSQRK
jgi:hypothetical protein